jgi:hypothetical protein
MEGYLGESLVLISETPFRNFKREDWAMYFIERYGQIDGDHHKLWVLDQVARILKGTKIIVKLAKWSNGEEEYRVWLSKPSNRYKKWVIEMKAGEDGPETYGYDEGIAP